MKWRDTLVGAGTALFVAIAGGVAVYYLTVGAKKSTDNEVLTYNLLTSATFGSDADRLTFQSIRLTNEGGKAARGVQITATFGAGQVIQDKRVELSAGIPIASGDESTSTTLNLRMQTLLPSEVATVSLLVRGLGVPQPVVRIFSNDTIATAAELPSATEDKRDGLKQSILVSTLIVLGFVFQLGIRRLLSRYLRRWLPPKLVASPDYERFPVYAGSDAAFLLAQGGFAEEAKELSRNIMMRSGGTPLLMANHALVIGILGDTEDAKKRLRLAAWWARDFRDRAVCHFNQAVLEFHTQNDDEGLASLQKAFAEDASEIASYCAINEYIAEAARRDVRVRDAIANAQTKKAS